MRSRPIPFFAGALAGGLVAVLVTLAVVGWRPSPGPVAVAPSASPAPSGVIAPTPIPTPAASRALHMGQLATVVAPGGVRLRKDPGGTWQSGRAATVPVGSVVYLDAHRTDGQGGEWWAIAPEHRMLDYGWVSAKDAHGVATLTPLAIACPDPDSVDVAAIVTLGQPSALVCFGNRELVLRGFVRCDEVSADMAVAGAGWLDERASCSIDGVLGLDGPVVTALLEGPAPQTTAVGRYEVRGHFDDPDARSCFTIPFGMSIGGPVSPPEPAAVVLCRRIFVVTSVTPQG